MEHLNQPVVNFTRKDFPILQESLTVGQALERIRREGLGEKIVYFYAVNAEQQLVGVIPTRRLLISTFETRLADIMIQRVIFLPETATVEEAAEFFVLHKLMAFPVVDAQRRILGIVDVNLFAREVYDLAERRQVEDVFQLIGVRLSELRTLNPLAVFVYRFRWLLATIGSGILCALLTARFEQVLHEVIVLAFFLPLILGVSESVGMQAMTIMLQQLHVVQASRREFQLRFVRELLPAALLGLACGVLVGLIAWAWRGDPGPGLAIGGSLACAVATASLLGVSVPMLLHALRWDPRIAAGPLTLAAIDLCTLLYYFNAARLLVV